MAAKAMKKRAGNLCITGWNTYFTVFARTENRMTCQNEQLLLIKQRSMRRLQAQSRTVRAEAMTL
jgi:hypothetical protein